MTKKSAQKKKRIKYGDPVDSRTGTVSTTAYAASKVLKGGPGNLVSIAGYNSSGSDQFIQLHNAVSLPANATVPLFMFKALAGSNFAYDAPPAGMPFTTG